MPVNATCTNCGKTYQAPDSMSGRSVRCKACGTVFRIEPPQLDSPEPGDLDFDALERSFAGEAVDTATGKPAITGKPSVDAKGKVSIARAANVGDVAVAGDTQASSRSNFRYRFPMAKQIDQFLPWVLVVGCLGLLFQWCRTLTESGQTDPPSTGVAISRFSLMLAAYVVIVFPAVHIAMHKASRNLRFSMPRAALWRSFSGFMPLLLLGGGLYMISGGGVGGLIFGVVLGMLVSAGTITLLYRLFPNEIPTVAGYTAGGAILGGTFAAAVLFAINLVALQFASMSKKEPTLFVSPIALGLRWQEKPVTLAVVPKPPVKPAPTVPPPTTQEVTAPPVMSTVTTPKPAGQSENVLVAKVEVPPVPAAFDLIVSTPLQSNILSVLRDTGGGTIELYNTSTWTRTTSSQSFQRSDWSVAANTDGDVAVRIVRSPSYRLESLPLIRGNSPLPIDFDSSNERYLFGFVSRNILLVIVHDGSKLSLERYDVRSGERKGTAIPFGKNLQNALDVSWTKSCVRMTPDGSAILVAGRASSSEGSPGRLALYDASNPGMLISKRDMQLNPRFDFRPTGLAINGRNQVAMLLNAENDAYYTFWELDKLVNGAIALGPDRLLVDRKLGVISSMRPREWEEWTYDALAWINDTTLLLFGTYIVDAPTGKILGETGLSNVTGQIRESENTVLVIQRENGLRQLLRVTFDPAAIEAAKK